MIGSGFRDKLYWRQTGGRMYHCFKKLDPRDGKGYVSLCGRITMKRSGGQSLDRPPPYARCARCDVEEAARRGWEDCAP